jgi:Alginate lyase
MKLLTCLLVLALQAAPAAAQLLIPTTVTTPQDAAAYKALIAKADTALAMKPESVLNKSLTPASGDKHDFLSFGPYWWPDPAKPDGLPYIRRDGNRNPDMARGSDSLALARLGTAVETLGLAYRFSRDERYAAKAAMLARVWFLDPATRMNPNFQHAQAIPGITTGRGIGIIEARWLIHINEGLAMLGDSKAWTPQDRSAMKDWLGAFYTWLRTSKNGRDEEGEHNNHGSWYDAQAAHLALVIGRNDDAKAILQQGLTRRLATHIAPDGSQPHELARTRSLDYSIFNLEALLICAQLADQVGLDWWGHATPDGRSLRGALAYIAPYADPAKAWPKKDLQDADRSRLLPLLALYLRHRDDAALRQVYETHAETGAADSTYRLFDSAKKRRP